MRVVTVEEEITYLLTVTLEAPADALRVGLADTTSVPYQLGGICCREYAHQPGAWAFFEFGSPDPDRIKPIGKARQPFEVPGNTQDQTGAKNVPLIVWSDWIGYKTSDSAQRPDVQFRVLVPPQTLPMTFPVGPGNLSKVLPDVAVRLVQQSQAAGDFVSAPDAPAPQWQPTNYAPMFVIQYQSRVPGVQIVMGGDSHLSGWFNFVQLAALRLSTPSLPIAMWNTAWGGQPSNTFWPTEDEAIDAAVPSVTVIEGWTANDGMHPAADDAYLGRVREMAARTTAAGGIPIILKGLPRNLFGSSELTSWQRINHALDTLVPGALVFDANAVVEDPQRAGCWRPEFTDDLIHPNLRGNLALVDPFETLLRGLL
jgi:hypothetical protein